MTQLKLQILSFLWWACIESPCQSFSLSWTTCNGPCLFWREIRCISRWYGHRLSMHVVIQRWCGVYIQCWIHFWIVFFFGKAPYSNLLSTYCGCLEHYPLICSARRVCISEYSFPTWHWWDPVSSIIITQHCPPFLEVFSSVSAWLGLHLVSSENSFIKTHFIKIQYIYQNAP